MPESVLTVTEIIVTMPRWAENVFRLWSRHSRSTPERSETYLGTSTGVAESGTAEEIKVLVEAGKSVAVLVERQRLETYLNALRESGLVFEYSNDGALMVT